MSKRSSTRPSKTRGKRARKDPVDHGDYNLEHDTNFEDDASEQEQKSPPRKRQRAARKSQAPARKKQVQGKPSRLVSLVDLPINIFTKIASHLLPVDIISLARLNKFLRNLLMRRSSVNIWHEAMDNDPFLPECPPDMSEPRYLALVFLKTCTSCGKAGKLEVDEVLRVRLCGPCRKSCLVIWNTVAPGIMPLIPFSGKIAPTPRRSYAYSLREDVPNLLAEYEQKKKLGDKAFQAWAAEKREIKEKRLKHAQMLKDYLGIMDMVREQEIDDTKAERQEEIEHRLEEMGWTYEDMDFDYPGCTNKRAWVDLVSQPKPLTDRGWTSLKPKLAALLETNRKQRLEKERQTRKQEREARLKELFRAIKDRDILTVEVSSHSPDSDGPTSASYEPPFPNFSHTLKSPVILDLYETDRSVAEMEAKLEQHRGEIEGYMTEWKNHVQSHFIKLAREGPKVGKKILQSTLIAHDKKSDPFTKLSDDVKRLLRADSFFSTTSQFGSDRSLTYGSILKVEGLIGAHKSTLPVVARAPPSLDQVRWHAEAHKAARELLRSMGRPNASYLEMTGKSIYSCGRCHDTGAKTWEQMVQHYVQEKQTHARIQEDIRSANSNVTYNNIHDPKLRTKQPLVRYSGAKATNESEPFECRVCPESPILQEVITSEAQVLKHLLDVHGIAKPEPEEHYGPQITEESEWYESGYYDSDDGFGLFGGDFSDDGISEGGGCAYARRRLAGYGGYGHRRYNRHYYSRPRCVHYAGDDDWW